MNRRSCTLAQRLANPSAPLPFGHRPSAVHSSEEDEGYDVSICLFRILQEALHNAMKHSGVVQYEGSLVGTSNEIQLRIHDNGSCFDIENAILGHGLGIVSMNERIKY